MNIEFIVYTVANIFIALGGIIGNIVIAKISKTTDLESQYKFNRYISKLAVRYKSAEWIIQIVEGQDLAHYCKASQKYIIKRYLKIRDY